MRDGTWRCDVCHKGRSFDEIGVMEHLHMTPGGLTVIDNVKYCRDDETCQAAAQTCNHSMLQVRRQNVKIRELESELQEGGNVQFLNAATLCLIVFVVGFLVGLGL